jgi:hypothetical protein
MNKIEYFLYKLMSTILENLTNYRFGISETNSEINKNWDQLLYSASICYSIIDKNPVENMSYSLEYIYENYKKQKWHISNVIYRLDLTTSFIEAIKNDIDSTYIAQLCSNPSFNFDEVKRICEIFNKSEYVSLFASNPNFTHDIKDIKWNNCLISANKFNKDPKYLISVMNKQNRRYIYNTTFTCCRFIMIESLVKIVMEYTMFI